MLTAYIKKRGAWKSVLRLSSTLISTAKFPHHKLRYRLARIVGMTKMRMLSNAFNEFVDIGKIDDQKNLYESYPDLYPSKKGLPNFRPSLPSCMLNLLVIRLNGSFFTSPFIC